MAALYGVLRGSRGEVTRTATKQTGIRAHVQTWDARVTVILDADGDCLVHVHDWQRGGKQKVIFQGNVHDLVAVEEG